MKIYWHKIPKCFQYAVMDRDNYIKVAMRRPELTKLCIDRNGDPVMDWIYASYNFVEEILKDFRYLIEHEEYELDGTEDWKTSLQERPKE